jgi:long-chain-fatty-acid--CoA ligase ACSBG
MLRGRNIFQGYLNDEAKTVETIEENGWMHTGDIGYIDNEGFVYITGRIKVFLHSTK